jgi:hypothetical protein
VDPWAGSYYVETLTNEIAHKAWEHIQEVEKLGGMAKAIETGIPKMRIEEAAARTQARIDSGEQKIIGLNEYRLEKEAPIDILAVDNTAVRESQVKRLQELRANRDQAAVEKALAAITECVKTGEGNRPDAFSLLLLEADMAGFDHGKKLHKMGFQGHDTAELSFTDVFVPDANLIGGEEGKGFIQLMMNLPLERLSIGVAGAAAAQAGVEWTIAYTKDREAFGQRIIDFQNTRFVLADLKAKLQVGWAHLDWAISRHLKGELTNEEGAAAKLWHTDLQWEVMDQCLQLHGGAGYMNEYPIARAWRAARVTRIFGGTNEIMKEVIGRSL